MRIACQISQDDLLNKEVIHCVDDSKGTGMIIDFTANTFGHPLLMVKWPKADKYGNKIETLHPSRVCLILK